MFEIQLWIPFRIWHFHPRLFEDNHNFIKITLSKNRFCVCFEYELFIIFSVNAFVLIMENVSQKYEKNVEFWNEVENSFSSSNQSLHLSSPACWVVVCRSPSAVQGIEEHFICDLIGLYVINISDNMLQQPCRKAAGLYKQDWSLYNGDRHITIMTEPDAKVQLPMKTCRIFQNGVEILVFCKWLLEESQIPVAHVVLYNRSPALCRRLWLMHALWSWCHAMLYKSELVYVFPWNVWLFQSNVCVFVCYLVPHSTIFQHMSVGCLCNQVCTRQSCG